MQKRFSLSRALHSLRRWPEDKNGMISPDNDKQNISGVSSTVYMNLMKHESNHDILQSFFLAVDATMTSELLL
jgi:hypothetical protein